MSECVSCGAPEANPPRDFCDGCESQFQAGLSRQQEVEARAEQLEAAKAAGDADTVGEIMTEIFKDSVVLESPVSQPVSAATAEKVSE